MASQAEEAADLLVAPHAFSYTYRRSLGPVLSAFMTALRDRCFVGVRAADGRVLVPPVEYDPETGEDLTEIVPVESTGTVVSWTWVARPREKQPLDRPFAYALVRLDGADTPLLHVVDAGSEDRMRTGMRVRARFRAETRGDIRDVEAFEPEGA